MKNNNYLVRRREIAYLAVITLLVAFSSSLTAQTESARDDAEMRACVDRALPEVSMRQLLTVIVTGGSGRSRETTRSLQWKRFEDGFSRALIRIIAPVNESGLAVLLKEREGIEPTIYMYTPELQRTRRVGGGAISGSIMGTDISYEDFTHFMKIIKSNGYTYLEDQEIDGYPVYVLETIPDDSRSAYSAIRTYMDQALCLPIKTEFFGLNGSLDKELSVDREQVKPIGNRQIPHRTMMVNHKNDTYSEFLVDEVEVDPDLRDSIFSKAELRRGHRGG
jgi:hypothetical protein